jgi:hypothetical protein
MLEMKEDETRTFLSTRKCDRRLLLLLLGFSRKINTHISPLLPFNYKELISKMTMSCHLPQHLFQQQPTLALLMQHKLEAIGLESVRLNRAALVKGNICIAILALALFPPYKYFL